MIDNRSSSQRKTEASAMEMDEIVRVMDIITALVGANVNERRGEKETERERH